MMPLDDPTGMLVHHMQAPGPGAVALGKYLCPLADQHRHLLAGCLHGRLFLHSEPTAHRNQALGLELACWLLCVNKACEMV